MASDIKRDEVTGAVEQVKLDEVITQGDPRWGIHNPEVGESDTLAIHEQDAEEVAKNAEAAQVDVPQSDPVPSDELYIVKPEEQASQQAAQAEADSSESSSKSSSSKKS